jgi:hypothetical protein
MSNDYVIIIITAYISQQITAHKLMCTQQQFNWEKPNITYPLRYDAKPIPNSRAHPSGPICESQRRAIHFCAGTDLGLHQYDWGKLGKDGSKVAEYSKHLPNFHYDPDKPYAEVSWDLDGLYRLQSSRIDLTLRIS